MLGDKKLMVRTNNRSNSKRKPAEEVASGKRSSSSNKSNKFDIDSELLGAEYNQVRRPVLPYGIVINDNPAGILIPKDQLEKANWLVMPEEDELTAITITEEITGLFITEARLLVLGFVPEYIRYKNDVTDIGNTIVGLYEEYRQNFDKKTMDAVSEHALVFLDENSVPLHSIPIVVRFKNVALWSFKAARDEFYRLLERTFADLFEIQFSGKSDKWRSLGVIECKFKAVKEGEGKNKHFCMKTISYTKPTVENLKELFLGTKHDKSTVWGLHDTIAGFSETPALPPSIEREVEILPPAEGNKKLPRKIEQVVGENDEDDEDLEEFDDEDISDETELDEDEEEEDEDFEDE